MKRIFLLFVLLPVACCWQSARAQRSDSIALYLLDRMSVTIRSLQSCSFVTHTNYDVWLDDVGYIKHSTRDDVDFKFPDKMKVKLWGDRGHRELFYDGTTFNYYSFANNTYASLPYEGTVVQAIDTLNRKYGIEFPAADFFYPTFLDDLLQSGVNLLYLGIAEVGDESCYHIAGNDVNGTVFQFWLSQDEYCLPKKMVLVYKESKGQPQYEAVYSDWKINNSLPDVLFTFKAPPSSKTMKMISVK